jgi:two-component system, sensor histidine kinase and response regulator
MTSSWGLIPRTVNNGAEALKELKNAFERGNAYQILLLDMQMPGLQGFDVAEKIKDTPWGKNLRTLILTSVGQKGDPGRCKDLGISAYLLKPVKQSELLDAVLMALGHEISDQGRVITRFTIEEARRRLNVLLAEDNSINQTLAVRMLEKRGYRVHVAPNGKDALRSFDQEKFDLILMDIQMPEMDGFEATRLIRELNRGKDVPIIAMTAHAMKGDRERCLAAGMDDYVAKPIKAEELFGAIDRCVARKPRKESEMRIYQDKETQEQKSEVFDFSKAMEMVGGDMGLLKEIAGLFIDSFPKTLNQMRQAIVAGDAHLFETAGHSLKGSVGSFGASRSYDAAFRLEKMGKAGNLAGADQAVTELERELKALEMAMRKVLLER